MIEELLEERAKKPDAYWVMSNQELKEKIMDELKNFFRPEFLNRLDEIIVFNTLSKEILKGSFATFCHRGQQLKAGAC